MEDFANLEFIEEPIYIHFDFPWRNYTRDDMEKDLISLKKKINTHLDFPLKYSRFGTKVADVFFQKVRLSTRTNTNPSCVEYWEKRKEKILEYNLTRNKGDLFQTISFMKCAPAHFSSYVACMVYKYFKAKTVFDPYAGWGNRCISAIVLGINYIGVDSNPDLCIPYNNLLEYFDNPKGVNFTHAKSEEFDIDNLKFDLMFSSPPFWNEKNLMLEKYKNCEKVYQTFLDTSLIPVIKKCINKSIKVCLYINEKMYNSLVKEFGKPIEILLFNSPRNKKVKGNVQYNKIYVW